ncbi:TSUP family transporter [Rubellimicrobium aerolatum]|uniref:Probable membrane transporter protein n=1 Tax=Rubellimicrobium aerolatum TaxID=490979 RepID=A0ABW0SD60_9RHOB|nr:TSUP family transporter [Rubellimicrobium aerolatum]MBP1806562.1 putative membrane protein YfcA [Rubellimicrobium aerolatum]
MTLLSLPVPPEVLLLLTLAAFLAGAIDSIAGGGGLLALPAILLAGAPPVTALATNKVQGMFGTASAALHYARAGLVEPRTQTLPALLALVAGGAGALLASRLPADTIRAALPVLLIAVALYFALKKGLGDDDRHERLRAPAFNATAVPGLAFYDGVLGPGTGSFYMMAFVTLRGMGLLRATAHTKLLNFASNIGSMAVFALVASPWWLVGLSMGAAQFAGAQVGSRLAVRVGARVIRPLLVVTSVALALRLLWQAWSG